MKKERKAKKTAKKQTKRQVLPTRKTTHELPPGQYATTC